MANPNGTGTHTGRANRVVALCGPYLAGKTSLLESLMAAAGALPRKGTASTGFAVGDGSPEARARQMSVEVNVASVEHQGDSWTFLDCPGSVEFQQETAAALMVADAAVVVCEPDPARALTLVPLLRLLEERHIPHFLFINKMDAALGRVRDLMAALQEVSTRKLVLRQVPIRHAVTGGGEETMGYIDLVSERAYRYEPGKPSALIEIPSDMKPREDEARRELLETLADYDDRLLEQLLEDAVPEKSTIYGDLHAGFARDLIVPVLIGAAEKDHGVRRLWKALRHDVPTHEETLARRDGLRAGEAVLAEIFKTHHQARTGKLSVARIWQGVVSDGQTFGPARIGGLFRLVGGQTSKLAKAEEGDIVAFGRLETAHTGQLLLQSGIAEPDGGWPAPPPPVYALAVHARNRADDVKLSTALQKLCEEDPSLSFENRPDTGELVLAGQGEIHLLVALDKLAGRYGVAVDRHQPRVAYRETIRHRTSEHGRYKRQTGGHGQFGDVKIEIGPLPRGEGFAFHDRIVGGAIPRQYIPAVEAGVRDFMQRGPLGFPVVDIEVTLKDGAFHTVDSSEQAFKQAARIAMTEGMAKCDPILLEPIMKVTVASPREATAKVQRLISGRRGQILGFDARPGWPGWDEVVALIPQAEISDLIVEIRSTSFGVGTYRAEFDHLQELTGKLAERARVSAGVAAG